MEHWGLIAATVAIMFIALTMILVYRIRKGQLNDVLAQYSRPPYVLRGEKPTNTDGFRRKVLRAIIGEQVIFFVIALVMYGLTALFWWWAQEGTYSELPHLILALLTAILSFGFGIWTMVMAGRGITPALRRYGHFRSARATVNLDAIHRLDV